MNNNEKNQYLQHVNKYYGEQKLLDKMAKMLKTEKNLNLLSELFNNINTMNIKKGGASKNNILSTINISDY